ncbi:chaperone NapD [Shewanella sp. 0m-4]
MEQEFHVTSMVVQVRPAQMSQVKQTIALMDAAEIAVSNEMKLVVVLEGDSQRTLMKSIEMINGLPGVLSAAMVYQQSEILEEGE